MQTLPGALAGLTELPSLSQCKAGASPALESSFQAPSRALFCFCSPTSQSLDHGGSPVKFTTTFLVLLAPKYLEFWHCWRGSSSQGCVASQGQRFWEQPSRTVSDSALSHRVPVARPHRRAAWVWGQPSPQAPSHCLACCRINPAPELSSRSDLWATPSFGSPLWLGTNPRQLKVQASTCRPQGGISWGTALVLWPSPWICSPHHLPT